MPNNLKHIQVSLSLILTDWSRLRLAQVPRCRDLAIFVVTTDGQTDRWTDKPITLHERGVIIQGGQSILDHLSGTPDMSHGPPTCVHEHVGPEYLCGGAW